VVLIWLSELKDARRITVQKQIHNEWVQYTVGTPDAYQQRSDIYISATAAMLAAEEQGLNTGYGVCHHNKMVAEQLGMPSYCAVVAMGMGYPADTADSEVPVLDAVGHQLGFCVPNTPPGNPHWNRDDKPTQNQMIKII
jgi:hypothetical protein